MGIAGFFLWLKQYYPQCIEPIPQPVVDAALKHKASPDRVGVKYRYDNLYIDMNGLLHPCCHDTAPLPEPACEEEMYERLFDQLDLLVKVVRPRKCLVLCVDGVAPRSKMNQQRSRRFRAADERMESDAIMQACADVVEESYGLPRPALRVKWDHNVITPSTDFMERMGMAVEWFIMKKVNEDPAWKQLTVVFSDAHVPGEGEHKIMQYIRGLRAQPGYHPNTSHVIHGMDADLICLGLSTHEQHISILRNQLTETFQPDHNRFCYFNLHSYREALKADFGNIKDADFERVIDDFIYLCFFVGNDFLPHIPLVSIKTQGIELLLDHYVRDFNHHGYLTQGGEVDFQRLSCFLKNFVKSCMEKLRSAYHGVERARRRARDNVEQRVQTMQKTLNKLRRVAAAVSKAEDPEKKSARRAAKTAERATSGADHPESVEDADPEAGEEEMTEEDMQTTDPLAVAQKVLSLLSDMQKERKRMVADLQPLPFSYLSDDYRDAYYRQKFGWSPDGDDDDATNSAEGSTSPKDRNTAAARAVFEEEIQMCCAEYLRGTQWVMRYYTQGCPSWGWYYPYHYAPLLQDLAAFQGTVNVTMKMGAPLHPVEQLLAVLPRQSVAALPKPLHKAVLDPKSALGPFYPETVEMDFSEANFSYQGVLRLPFINCKALHKAVQTIAELGADAPLILVFSHEKSTLSRLVAATVSAASGEGALRGRQKHERGASAHPQQQQHSALASLSDPEHAGPMAVIPDTVVSTVPIAGSLGTYEAEWPQHAKLDCPDRALAKASAFGSPIKDNAVRCLRYEPPTGVPYRQELIASSERGPRAGKRKREDPVDESAAPQKESPATPSSSPTRKRARATSEEPTAPPSHRKRSADEEPPLKASPTTHARSSSVAASSSSSSPPTGQAPLSKKGRRALRRAAAASGAETKPPASTAAPKPAEAVTSHSPAQTSQTRKQRRKKAKAAHAPASAVAKVSLQAAPLLKSTKKRLAARASRAAGAV